MLPPPPDIRLLSLPCAHHGVEQPGGAYVLAHLRVPFLLRCCGPEAAAIRFLLHFVISDPAVAYVKYPVPGRRLYERTLSLHILPRLCIAHYTLVRPKTRQAAADNAQRPRL